MATLSIYALCYTNQLSVVHIPLEGQLALALSHVGNLCSYLAFDPWVRERKLTRTVGIMSAALVSCCLCGFVLSTLTTPWARDTLLLIAANTYLWLRLQFDF